MPDGMPVRHGTSGMDKSIKPGDVISFTGHTGTSTENFGWVQELRGRYVVVRDRDGVDTLVPNQNLVTRLMAFEDYGMRLEVRFWIADPMNGVNNVRSDVNRAIWRIFRQHGVKIPVAQRELRIVERVSPPPMVGSARARMGSSTEDVD